MTGDVKSLTVWSKAMKLCQHVYQITNSLPVEERFALGNQIRRCSISIPSNIAEGYGRNSEKEFVKFLYISRGSTYELETQMILCSQIYPTLYLQICPLLGEIKEISKMLTSLINYYSTKTKD